ncbi:hypothetical protein GGS21DRAFT_486541 [Xylaria nigripes]|nr:hypothetical protein GGS21DRAFT_486541 [Xylaria nigripes]
MSQILPMLSEKESPMSRPVAQSVSPSASEGEVTGKTAIVTGANCGIGLACANQLLNRGLSKLILAVRDERKGAIAKKSLMSGRNDEVHTIEVWSLDYCSYDSIMNFVHRANGLENLDIVVLNAGVYRMPCVILPETGHEEAIQVNYLSTALLAISLLPILSAKRRSEAKPGRLTMVSSSVAGWSRLKPREDGRPLLSSLDEQMGANAFDHHQQYCTSKLLGQLFLVELVHRVPPSVAIVNCVNPGLCYGSDLARDSEGTFMGFIARVIFRVFGRTCASGAQAIIDGGAVGHDMEVHGCYVDAGKPARFAPVVYTPEGRQMAEMLWQEMVKELSFAGVESIIKELTNEAIG